MRVVPVGGRIIFHRKGRRPCRAASHHLTRTTIHDRGNVEAMPVHGGGSRTQQCGVGQVKVVAHVELHGVSLIHDQCRPPHQSAIVTQSRCTRRWSKCCRGIDAQRRVRRRIRRKLLVSLIQVQIKRRPIDRRRDDERVVSLSGGQRHRDRTAVRQIARTIGGRGDDRIRAKTERHRGCPGGKIVAAGCGHIVHLHTADTGERIATRPRDSDRVGSSGTSRGRCADGNRGSDSILSRRSCAAVSR